MKIICQSQEEYDELMATSRYLHDFWVTTSKGDIISLNGDISIVGFLQHIHLEKENFPNKEEYFDIDPSVHLCCDDEDRWLTKTKGKKLDDSSKWMTWKDSKKKKKKKKKKGKKK